MSKVNEIIFTFAVIAAFVSISCTFVHAATAMNPVRDNVLREAIKISEETCTVPPEQWVRRSLTMSQQERYHESIALYQRALRARPDMAKAYYALGSAYFQLHAYQESAGAFQRAILLNPDVAAGASMNLGLVYETLGLREDAHVWYLKAVKENPDDHEAYYRLGRNLFMLQKYREAEDAFRAVLTLKADDADTRAALGIIEDLARSLPAGL